MIARTLKGQVREYRVLRERAMRKARILSGWDPAVWGETLRAFVAIARHNNRELVRLARDMSRGRA